LYIYAKRGIKMQNATLHIKVDPEIAQGLKELSRKRDTSVGELVRRAVISCYQLEFIDLSEKQRRALEAFQGEYISLGKLAEEFGMSVWDIREWLKEHNIVQNSSFLESDINNA
jgi:predicted HTH domain antitoxin